MSFSTEAGPSRRIRPKRSYIIFRASRYRCLLNFDPPMTRVTPFTISLRVCTGLATSNVPAAAPAMITNSEGCMRDGPVFHEEAADDGGEHHQHSNDGEHVLLLRGRRPPDMACQYLYRPGAKNLMPGSNAGLGWSRFGVRLDSVVVRAGDCPVNGHCTRAFDQHDQGKRDGQQVVLIALAFLLPGPVQEEAIRAMHFGDGDQHVHDDSQSRD